VHPLSSLPWQEGLRERVVTITDEGVNALLSGIPFWEQAQNHVSGIIGGDRSALSVNELSNMISMLRKR
jgi:hypothetical protein